MSLREFAKHIERKEAKREGKKGSKQLKYGNKPRDGFPSGLEAAVFGVLCFREKAGEIRDIRRQQTVVLQGGGNDTRIAWKIDFSFVECSTGWLAYAEAKGVETDEFKLKLKLYRMNPPAKLEIWKGSEARPILVETIQPKRNA